MKYIQTVLILLLLLYSCTNKNEKELKRTFYNNYLDCDKITLTISKLTPKYIPKYKKEVPVIELRVAFWYQNKYLPENYIKNQISKIGAISLTLYDQNGIEVLSLRDPAENIVLQDRPLNELKYYNTIEATEIKDKSLNSIGFTYIYQINPYYNSALHSKVTGVNMIYEDNFLSLCRDWDLKVTSKNKLEELYKETIDKYNNNKWLNSQRLFEREANRNLGHLGNMKTD